MFPALRLYLVVEVIHCFNKSTRANTICIVRLQLETIIFYYSTTSIRINYHIRSTVKVLKNLNVCFSCLVILKAICLKYFIALRVLNFCCEYKLIPYALADPKLSIMQAYLYRASSVSARRWHLRVLQRKGCARSAPPCLLQPSGVCHQAAGNTSFTVINPMSKYCLFMLALGALLSATVLRITLI